MDTKEGAKLIPQESGDNLLAYQGATFAGRETEHVGLEFVDDKFYFAFVKFIARPESGTLDLYESIQSDLNEKYYKTSRAVRKFSFPFEENDGQSLLAVKSGNAKIASV
jgi:hypothetical protein